MSGNGFLREQAELHPEVTACIWHNTAEGGECGRPTAPGQLLCPEHAAAALATEAGMRKGLRSIAAARRQRQQQQATAPRPVRRFSWAQQPSPQQQASIDSGWTEAHRRAKLLYGYD